MTSKWTYANAQYETELAANEAVSAMKFRLENNPSYWCTVKEITGSEVDGWSIPATQLSDSEAMNLSDDKVYMVSSNITGENYIGITGLEAAQKVLSIRTKYAQLIQANTIAKSYTPVNEDMTVYVNG